MIMIDDVKPETQMDGGPNPEAEEAPDTPPEDSALSTEPEELKPKPPAKLAPRGIRTFTVCRQADETGISGDGVIIEGVSLATGQCIIHWLYPLPSGAIAIFNGFDDFLKVHVHPHPSNKTIITWEDGEQEMYGDD